MPRRPDVLCAGGCGNLMWRGKGALPEGAAMCRPCRARKRAEAGLPPRSKYGPWDRAERICPCGTNFTPRRRDQRLCSAECKRPWRNPERERDCCWCGRQFRTTDSRQQACSYGCAGSMRQLKRGNVPKSPVPWKQCLECDRWFVRKHGRICSDQCRSTRHQRQTIEYVDKRNNSERVLGLYYLAVRELDVPRACHWRRVLTDHLARRDGQHCGICGEWVDLELPSGPRGNPMGPSIDHIIPVSQGGEHTMVNVRLTHWTCNQRRGNRGGNEQLKLIA